MVRVWSEADSCCLVEGERQSGQSQSAWSDWQHLRIALAGTMSDGVAAVVRAEGECFIGPSIGPISGWPAALPKPEISSMIGMALIPSRALHGTAVQVIGALHRMKCRLCAALLRSFAMRGKFRFSVAAGRLCFVFASEDQDDPSWFRRSGG
jgi:hypothetical protein